MRGSLFVTVVCGLIVNALDAPAQTAFNYDPSGNVVTLSNVAAIVPPAFLFTPRFASAESNGVLSVCAPITGVGPFNYQWFFNGVAVPCGTNDAFLLTGTQPADLGSYQLIAANDAGAVTSAVINVYFYGDYNKLMDVCEPGAVWEAGFVKNAQYLNISSVADVESRQVNVAFCVAKPAFESRTGNSGPAYDGERISGFFVPATDGDHVFFTCSDDQSDLFLSTDSNPAHKRLIAQEQGWSNPWQWTTANAGSVTQKRSDRFIPNGGTTAPYAGGIHLVGGQWYYLEFDQYNGGGGDNVEVTVKKLG